MPIPQSTLFKDDMGGLVAMGPPRASLSSFLLLSDLSAFLFAVNTRRSFGAKLRENIALMPFLLRIFRCCLCREGTLPQTRSAESDCQRFARNNRGTAHGSHIGAT